jgi:hypothetical protein
MIDETNLRNVRMFITYVVVFIMAMILLIGCSVLFGGQIYSSASNAYDRPVASMGFHDHRL